jgi:TonB family protein
MPSMRGVNTLNGNQMIEPRGVGSSESPEDFFEPLYPESTSLDAHLFLPAVRLFEDIVKEPKAAADSEMRKAEGQFDKIVDSILGNSFRNDSLPPLRLDEQYTPPRLIKRVKPDYPVEARLRRIEGTVILEATTDEHGIVKDIKVQRSIPALNQAAVEAVRQWIYEPMIINGRPRKVIFRVTVNFELTKPDKF